MAGARFISYKSAITQENTDFSIKSLNNWNSSYGQPSKKKIRNTDLNNKNNLNSLV